MADWVGVPTCRLLYGSYTAFSGKRVGVCSVHEMPPSMLARMVPPLPVACPPTAKHRFAVGQVTWRGVRRFGVEGLSAQKRTLRLRKKGLGLRVQRGGWGQGGGPRLSRVSGAVRAGQSFWW